MIALLTSLEVSHSLDVMDTFAGRNNGLPKIVPCKISLTHDSVSCSSIHILIK